MAIRPRRVARLTKMSFARPLCIRLASMGISIGLFRRQQIVRDVSAASGRERSAAVAETRDLKTKRCCKMASQKKLTPSKK
jgi:hypothetical protein